MIEPTPGLMESQMENQASNELEALKRIVIETVVDAWEKEERAVPLARLGKLLEERGFRVQKVLEGRKSDAIRVIANPKLELTFAATPAHVTLDEDLARYFRPASKGKSGSAGGLRLNSVFWAAFTKPIGPSLVRTFDMEPIQRFQDVSPAAADAAGKPKVLPEDIVVDAADHPTDAQREAVTKKALEWADANSVPRERLQAHPGLPKAPIAPAQSPGRDNLLSRVVSALSDEELKSVSMSLAVVKRLLATE
jgi:hypothetical protein